MTAMPAPIYDDAQTNDEGFADSLSLLDNEFTITGRLSHGGFGITYLAKDNRLNRTVVIDFGAAREEASKKTHAVSTVMVVKGGCSPHEFYFVGSKQNASNDLCALATTFYHLISGQAPINSQTCVSEIVINNPDHRVRRSGSFPDLKDAFLAAIDKAHAGSDVICPGVG